MQRGGRRADELPPAWGDRRCGAAPRRPDRLPPGGARSRRTRALRGPPARRRRAALATRALTPAPSPSTLGRFGRPVLRQPFHDDAGRCRLTREPGLTVTDLERPDGIPNVDRIAAR